MAVMTIFLLEVKSVTRENATFPRETLHLPRCNFSISMRDAWLWARDFYRVIVDEGEARINYHA